MNALITTAMRQEIHGFVDILPDAKLPTIKSLLEMLTDDWTPIIETNLTKAEKECIRRSKARQKTHPEDFITLEALEEQIYGKKSA
ncbi:hypothetical protein AGMMS50229_12710 [Campylobacterota bacterium]|nr:hypothetical protein AGMMS50229_12710 [Campylobacterota bacterium]